MNINNPVNDRKSGTQYATKESVTAAAAGLNAHHTCIWRVTTVVFGILAPGIQSPE